MVALVVVAGAVVVVVVTIPETFLPAFYSRSEFGFPEIPPKLQAAGQLSILLRTDDSSVSTVSHRKLDLGFTNQKQCDLYLNNHHILQQLFQFQIHLLYLKFDCLHHRL